MIDMQGNITIECYTREKNNLLNLKLAQNLENSSPQNFQLYSTTVHGE